MTKLISNDLKMLYKVKYSRSLITEASAATDTWADYGNRQQEILVSMSAPRMDTLQIPRDDCANYKYKLALAIYTYRINSLASVANDLHHTLKGAEGGDQK